MYQKVLNTLSFLPQFPHCTEDRAISVACLDLHYYVNVSSHVKETDEKYNHSPITLNDLRPEDELTLTQSRSMDFEGKCQFSFTFIYNRGTGHFSFSFNAIWTQEKQQTGIYMYTSISTVLPIILMLHIIQELLLRTHKKKILKGISAYFNPNELIAIMGPSGG